VGSGAEELGGIYVFPEFRSLGVSRALLDFLVRHARAEDLYCLPFCNLIDLYASFAFTPIKNTARVPLIVKRKHAWCNERYTTPVLLLHRAAPRPDAQRAPQAGGLGTIDEPAPASATRNNTAVASSPGFSRG
jgi:GNAT superfamily N-acetyltransferase